MRLRAWILALALLLTACAGLAEAPVRTSGDYEPLYPCAEARGFKLGGAFGAWDMNNKPFMDFLGRHFNSLTCTNETKAYSLLAQAASQAAGDDMPRMNYAVSDRMVGWCAERGIGVRGHALVWDAYMTDWFFREGFGTAGDYCDRDTVRARMKYYIEDVVTHFEEKFPGVIYCWDVVNEAVADDPRERVPGDPRHLRATRGGEPNRFYELAGDDYVEYAFLCARDAADALGADIRLFYNDYNMFMADKRAAVLNLVDSINGYATEAGGEPRKLIDGIGMQGYLGGYGVQEGCLDPALPDQLKESIRMYADRGLEVQITEMTVRNFDAEKAAEHADFYARLFTDVFMQANDGEENPLTAVCIWGLVDAPAGDKDSYVYKLNSPYGGLMTAKYELKPCFDALYNALAEGE